MKKLVFLIALLAGLALPAVAGAQYDPFGDACEGQSDATVCQSRSGDDPIAGRGGVIMRVVRIFSFVVGAATVIMVMFSGMKFITAGGDSTKIATARDTLLYALVGAVVFVFCELIIRFVISRL